MPKRFSGQAKVNKSHTLYMRVRGICITLAENFIKKFEKKPI
jgi:hypothetical protein